MRSRGRGRAVWLHGAAARSLVRVCSPRTFPICCRTCCVAAGSLTPSVVNAWFPRITGHSLVVVLSLLTYVLTTRAERERRPPSIAIAWVLGLIALPYLALPIVSAVRPQKTPAQGLAVVGRALRGQALGRTPHRELRPAGRRALARAHARRWRRGARRPVRPHGPRPTTARCMHLYFGPGCVRRGGDAAHDVLRAARCAGASDLRAKREGSAPRWRQPRWRSTSAPRASRCFS